MFLGFEFHRFVGKVFLLGGKFWAYFEDQLSQIMTEKTTNWMPRGLECFNFMIAIHGT